MNLSAWTSIRNWWRGADYVLISSWRVTAFFRASQSRNYNQLFSDRLPLICSSFLYFLFCSDVLKLNSIKPSVERLKRSDSLTRCTWFQLKWIVLRFWLVSCRGVATHFSFGNIKVVTNTLKLIRFQKSLLYLLTCTWSEYWSNNNQIAWVKLGFHRTSTLSLELCWQFEVVKQYMSRKTDYLLFNSTKTETLTVKTASMMAITTL